MKTRSLMMAAVACTVLGATMQAEAAAPKWTKKGDTVEKCQGIAKKGANDCGANGHDCAGNADKDNDAKEWVFVPEGVCEKIAGGSIFLKKKF